MRANNYDLPPECCGGFMDMQDDGTYKCFYCKCIEKDRAKEWYESLDETNEEQA